jgi:DNA-binding CsgD family transcriptional regulator
MQKKSPDRCSLGARQREILVYAALGYSYKQTARALDISVNTVKNALQAITAKLGASSRAHAVTLALRQGVLNLEVLKQLVVPQELQIGENYGPLMEQIVTYVAQGYLNKEIGQALGTSEQYVKNCILSIMKKLGARNRVHLVILAAFQDLLDSRSLPVEQMIE